jgi:serine/threonine protein kinase
MAGRGLKLEVPQYLRDLQDQLVLPSFVRIGDPFSIYSKIGQIGEGSFGSVVKVRLPNGLFKAVKIVNAAPLRNADISKALREAEIGMQMNHPHLLPIEEVWYDGTRFLFVMDLIEPLTVSSLPKSPKEKKEILALFLQLVSADVHLYSEGILHRDIKAQNCGIMRDKDGGTPRLVLFDFGEACKISDDCQECAGTALHMAPELMNFSPHGDRSEVWTLMSFLIEILTGKPMILHLFGDEIIRLSTYLIQRKIDTLTEPPIPEVLKTDKSPSGILLLQILRRGLALDPEERLTFPELQALLQQLLENL